MTPKRHSPVIGVSFLGWNADVIELREAYNRLVARLENDSTEAANAIGKTVVPLAGAL